jgi:group I intron endonuclease
MLKQVVIYGITSLSGRIYIGQTRDFIKRLENYRNKRCKHQLIIYASLNKYGFENHNVQILHNLPTGVSQHILNVYEQLYMDFYAAAGIRLMNLRPAGNGAMTDEIKKKLSIAGRGKKLSPERKAAISERMKGKRYGVGYKHSEEWKKQNSIRHKGKQHALGAKHTPEMNAHKSAILIGNKRGVGVKQSQETRDKRSASLKLFYKNKIAANG